MSGGFGLYTCKDNLLPCCEFKEHENFVLGKYGLCRMLLLFSNLNCYKEVACITTTWVIIVFLLCCRRHKEKKEESTETGQHNTHTHTHTHKKKSYPCNW